MSHQPGRLALGVPLTTTGGQPITPRAWAGEGSYALVFRGEWGAEARPCALKVARTEVAGAARHLQAEAAILRQVRHPRLVQLLDAGEQHGLPFSVLEWLEGETLKERLQRDRRLPLRQALEYGEAVLELAAGLTEVGRRHGDLRADNLIVVAKRGLVALDPCPGPEPAPRPDLHAVGELLCRMLWADRPAHDGTLPEAETGFSPAVRELVALALSPAPPSAAQVLSRIRRAKEAL